MPREPNHRAVSPNAREITENGTHFITTKHFDVSHLYCRGGRVGAILVQTKLYQGGGSRGH